MGLRSGAGMLWTWDTTHRQLQTKQAFNSDALVHKKCTRKNTFLCILQFPIGHVIKRGSGRTLKKRMGVQWIQNEVGKSR